MMFECERCYKEWKTKKGLDNHKCTMVERMATLNEKHGMMGLISFTIWAGSRTPNIQTFIESRYFNAFIRFARFIDTYNIPNHSKYIEFLISKRLSPDKWTNDLAFREFLKTIEIESATVRFEISMNNLMKIARKNDKTLPEIFEILSLNQFRRLIETKNIDKWTIFYSKIFQKKLMECRRAEQIQYFSKIFKSTQFITEKALNHDEIHKISDECTRLGI
jgi:hypothetical protein